MWSLREPDLRQPENLEGSESGSESIDSLEANLAEQFRREAELSGEISKLRERIGDSSLENLVPRLRSLKMLENQEAELRVSYDARRVELEAEVSELEERLGFGLSEGSLLEELDQLVNCSVERLDLSKKELAWKLRTVLGLKRRVDDVPTQAELMQYERRFSELNAHIQEKHQQTRKCYDTYNALLEIKEWMLKETSLLNSISSQFQDAIVSAEGRMKLIASMEGIVKSSQQKLQKVTSGLEEEQKVCDALKKRFSTAMAEQKRCYSLLKDFRNNAQRMRDSKGIVNKATRPPREPEDV